MEAVCEYTPVKKLKLDHLSLNEKSAVVNVYHYFKHQNPSITIDSVVETTSKAMGYGKSTIYRVLKEEKSGGVTSPKPKPGRPKLLKVNVDEFFKNAIRKLVHSFFINKQIPTLDKVLQAITNDVDLPTISRDKLWKVYHELNFKFEKMGRHSMIIDSEEIVCWRRQYLRRIQQVKAQNKNIYYLDETWVNEGHCVGRVWKDKNIKSSHQAFLEGYTTGFKEPIGKADSISQRYVLGIMGFLCTINTYALRVVLNVAITQMSIQESTKYTDPETCPENDMQNFTSSSVLKTTIKNPIFDWDESTKGLILSSFFWGYIVTHIPGGIWAEKYGGKHILGVGMLIASVLTVLTPWIVIASNGNWGVIVLTRVIVGLGQGTSNPALNGMLAKWVPASERSTIGTMVYSGSQVGTVLCSGISGALITATQTWSSVFYFFGGSGILWYIFWQILCYSSPEQHPFISKREKEFLRTEIDGVTEVRPQIPWKAFFTSAPVWALIAAQVGHDWGFYTILTELPTYMSEVLKFNILDNGIWNSVPYIVMWICSMCSGKLCDWMITKGYISVTFARKFFTTLSSVGPTIFIMAASYSGCNKAATVGMFTIALFFTGPFYCGFKVNALDIAPNHAGILMAIVNGCGAFTGGVVPYLAGALTEDHTLMEWRTVFWITGAVFVITSIIFCIWGSGELQDWNDLEATATSKKAEKTDQYEPRSNKATHINELA